MKKIALTLSILLFLGLTNLKAQENFSKPTKKEVTPKKEKYALEISFISIGHGIDGASYDKIDTFIKNHPKKPLVTTVQKGREGEKVMYLKLSELSKKEKHEFIKEVENLIVNKDLVKITKNLEVETPETKQ